MKSIFSIIILIFSVGCGGQSVYEDKVFSSTLPKVELPADNPFNAEVVALGKALFFDAALSKNGEVSCASCHFPVKAFTDMVALGNKGVSKKSLLRHAPTLVNLAYATNGLFWDGGAKNLESLVFAPLTHPDEMGADLRDVEEYLKQNSSYNKTIKSLYDTEDVKAQFAAKAIAQYVRTLVSDQSKYDRVMRAEDSFSEMEAKGYRIFQENCNACHSEPLLTDNIFHNNGLDGDFTDPSFEYIDSGRYRITHDTLDLGKFKTPTLRNISITAPYMHDGRFKTIDEVLNHYDNGINTSTTLDSLLYQDSKLGLPLSSEKKAQLKAFLFTLTDFLFL
jgi:cytochrome c peroxidase